ncbi:MAG TPA: hypothetical protein VGB85_07205 [Nannocystis sp.]
MPLELFAVTQPGLEDICAAEVAELGLGPGTTVPGGVTFTGEAVQLATANLRLSVATRVLVRVAEFRAPGFPELHARAGKLAWERFIPADAPPRLCFHVSAHKSRLYHTGGIAERVAKGIGERLGSPPEMIAPGDDDAEAEDDTRAPTRIYVRLDHDRCTVSVDSSGDPLHRRGYRLALARAPLRPTLAAAMLRACGWQPGAPLLDPMCGSGTIVLEAARRACGRPPGGDRQFAFLAWPGLPGAAALAQARGDLSPGTADAAPGLAATLAPIVGSDRDPGAITAARANAERAGVADAVTLAVRPLSAIEPLPAPGFVVCNPPYGVRVGKRGPLRDLYAQLGHVLRDRCPGARVALLCGDDLWHHCGLPLGITHHLKNGGLPVQLVQGRVPA